MKRLFSKLLPSLRGKKDLKKWRVLPSGEKSIQLLIEKSELGDTESQAILSLLFMNGQGLEQDIGKGFELIEKAASDFYSLNMCYKAGAERKEPGAHYGLFVMWKNGWGVPKNQDIANKHLMNAANSSFPRAMMVLGLEYNSGFSGIKKDISEAERWLRKAADAGINDANTHLHHIYYKEDGFINYGLAFDCIAKAATSGWPADLQHLGKMYENGLGVEKNLIEAGMYYYLAVCQSKVKAAQEKSSLVRVCVNLDFDDTEKVRQQALRWIEENAKKANRFNAVNEPLSDPLEYYNINITSVKRKTPKSGPS